MLEYMWIVEYDSGETEARDACSCLALKRRTSNERLETRGGRMAKGVSPKVQALYNVPKVLERTAELKSNRISQASPEGHSVTGRIPFRMQQTRRGNNC